MFEVQAGKGLVGAKVFKAAGSCYRRSDTGQAPKAGVFSAAGGLCVLLSRLESFDGQFPNDQRNRHRAIVSPMTRIRPSLPMRNGTQDLTTIAKALYSVKMSAEGWGKDPRNDRSFSTANALRIELSQDRFLSDARRSGHYRDKWGLKVCR
jgi:hypothetical protein